MTEDRRRTDPDVAARLSMLADVVVLNDFPNPRIENLAQTALDGLAEIRSSFSKKDLKTRPVGDTLAAVWENYLFMREEIFPYVTELIQRTGSPITFDKYNVLGCVFLNEDEGGDGSLAFAVDDDSGLFDSSISSPHSAQEVWDKSTPIGRSALRKFSNMTKGKIIKKFEKYSSEYTA